MANGIPQLRTPGVIADELGVPLSRVLYVLQKRSHDIKPIGRAGVLRLYDQPAVEMVRNELNAIDQRHASMNTTKGDWRRVSKAKPCPVCGKPDWCLVTGPQGDSTAAICARVESPKRCGEAGWLHVLRDDGPAWPPWRRTIRKAVRMMTEAESNGIDFDRLAAEWQPQERDAGQRGEAKSR